MELPIKILIIALVKKSDSILMRKKPDGSPPYSETWYLFGAELVQNNDVENTINKVLQEQSGVSARYIGDIGWDMETKADHDGVKKQFIYLDAEFEYKGGEIKPGEGIEKIKWVPISNIPEYDIVPPSRKLFKKLGYI